MGQRQELGNRNTSVVPLRHRQKSISKWHFQDTQRTGILLFGAAMFCGTVMSCILFSMLLVVWMYECTFDQPVRSYWTLRYIRFKTEESLGMQEPSKEGWLYIRWNMRYSDIDFSSTSIGLMAPNERRSLENDSMSSEQKQSIIKTKKITQFIQ